MTDYSQKASEYPMGKPNEPVGRILVALFDRQIAEADDLGRTESSRQAPPRFTYLRYNSECSLMWLDLQHQLWLSTLNGRLHTTVLPNEVNSILDIACGTGAWALAMTHSRPSTQVIAFDLTPPNIKPPPNLQFVKADAEKPWPFGQFSFIHGRMITSGIHDWPRLLARCWDHLEPGGWLELLDVCHPYRLEEDPTADSDPSPFIQFGDITERCWSSSGLDFRASTKHIERLRDLGFMDLDEEEFKWPLGEWPVTQHERRMGAFTLENFNRFLNTAAVNLLQHNADLDEQEARNIVANVQKDVAENSSTRHFYLTIARKPVEV
ncbi:MAG: hypothetical protein M1816_003616 [Peltula sp. TS41687]|nr:MAG: hypothetical protein M1816_003616 [Peltula sp. TS41687]